MQKKILKTFMEMGRAAELFFFFIFSVCFRPKEEAKEAKTCAGRFKPKIDQFWEQFFPGSALFVIKKIFFSLETLLSFPFLSFVCERSDQPENSTKEPPPWCKRLGASSSEGRLEKGDLAKLNLGLMVQQERKLL